MSKIAINNEIILMRQAVRQSRVSVVRKLIKEAKLLQARKHGDEKIREKCKRKAQRLLAEIAAIKKIKDDEISKFAIGETRNLQEVLSDLSVEANTRVMARLTFHKILHNRISKFKEKFPKYEEHLGPGRKKLSKLQRKANREARNGLRENKETNEAIPQKSGTFKNDIDIEKVDGVSEESSEEENYGIEDSEDVDEAVDIVNDENVEEDETNAQIIENVSNKDDSKSSNILNIKSPRSTSKLDSNDSIPEHSEKPQAESKKLKKLIKARPAKKLPTETKKCIPIKVISREATVKRFSDLMEDKESAEIVKQPDNSGDTRESDLKIEKQVDSFFMTEDGDSEYMRVVVTKPKLCENEELDDSFSQNHAAKRQKNFHERNNKFFSKIDQRSNKDYGDKFGSNVDKRKTNNYSNGQMEKIARCGKGPGRNVKSNFEKNNEIKEEELHPSWAARKKQQEILKQGFQGKKIVFDD